MHIIIPPVVIHVNCLQLTFKNDTICFYSNILIGVNLNRVLSKGFVLISDFLF